MACSEAFPFASYLIITQPPPPSTTCHDWIKHIVLKEVVEDCGKVCVQRVLLTLSGIFSESDGLNFGHVWSICRGLGMIPMKDSKISTKQWTYLRWPLCPFTLLNMVMRVNVGGFLEFKLDELANKALFVPYDELMEVLRQMEMDGLAVIKPKGPKWNARVRIFHLPRHPARVKEAYEIFTKVESI